MIQRSTYATRQKNPPQKFIPRRDLFPDAELPPPSRAASAKAAAVSSSPYKEQTGSSYRNSSQKQQSQAQAQSQARVQPVSSGRTRQQKNQPLPLQQPLKPVKQSSLLSVNPTVLFLLLGGGFLLWPTLKASQPKLVSKVESTLKNILDNPQSIQMLRTVGPYLEDKEQEAVFTVAGVMEAVSTLRGVMDHTYHDRHRNTILNVPSNPAAKRLEVMKAMKPYIPKGDRTKLDHAIGAYNTIDQLNRNINIYRNNRILASDKKPAAIETILDIFNVVRPALPLEYREKGDKAVQVLKMMEVAGAAEKMSRDSKKEKSASQKSDRDSKKDKVTAMSSDQASETAENTAAKSDQIQNLVDSFAPMLNDEQKDTMNIIMKMAQVLTQPSSDSQDSDLEEQ